MPPDRDPADDREGPRRGDRLSGGEVATLAGQLAGLTATGLPLPSGLRALGDELPAGALRRTFHDVARRVEAGEPLDAALAAQGRRLPGHLRGLVLAGARSGRLGNVLSHYVDAARAGADIRRGLRLSLAYPAMLLGLAGTLFLFVCTFVAPDFDRIFKDFGLPIPAPTRLVTAIAVWVGAVGVWAVPTLIGLALAVWAAGWIVLGPDRRWRLVGELPLVGTLWRWTAMAEFSHLLGLLIEGELPLPDALILAGDGVRDAGLGRAGRDAARDVAAGADLATALARRPRFPAGYARLVGWGEGHRALADVLHVLGSMYEARARAHAAFLGVLVNVLATVLVLGMILFILLALLLPIITMMSVFAGVGGGRSWLSILWPW